MPDRATNNGPRRPNRSIISKDPYDQRDIMYDRWLPLLHKGATVTPDAEYKTARWHYYLVKPEETISEQIYCSDLPLQEHDPISRGRRIGLHGVRDGIEEWGPKLAMKLPNLPKVGFKLRRFGKKWCYEVYCRLVLKCRGANVTFKWELAHPDTPPIDAEGKECETLVKVLTISEEYELCDEAFSPFARTSAESTEVKGGSMIVCVGE